jgi:flagellin FlaB
MLITKKEPGFPVNTKMDMLKLFLHKIRRSQKGITGLETAIIMIAFVTVASVLAYTVLSAGIFSSERGKEAVYAGLQGTMSTMGVKGSVIGQSSGGNLTTVTFTLALVIQGASVDMDALVLNYMDKDDVAMGTPHFTYALGSGSTERGIANLLEADEQMVVTVDISSIATLSAPRAYDSFTLQIMPPNGAAITIQRTLTGGMGTVFSLN